MLITCAFYIRSVELSHKFSGVHPLGKEAN